MLILEFLGRLIQGGGFVAELVALMLIHEFLLSGGQGDIFGPELRARAIEFFNPIQQKQTILFECRQSLLFVSFRSSKQKNCIQNHADQSKRDVVDSEGLLLNALP